MLTKEPIKSAQTEIADLQKVYENLEVFADASELALILCLERFCSEAITNPKERWQYCRQTARELFRWKSAFEDYLEGAWAEVSEEWNEDEDEWEHSTIPHYALSLGGYLIDTVMQEIITLPYGAIKLLESMDEDARSAGLRLNQIVALYNGAFNLKAHRDPRKARSTMERKRIEADRYLEKAWKEYKFLRAKQAEEYLVYTDEGRTLDNDGHEKSNMQILDFIEARSLTEVEALALSRLEAGDYGAFGEKSIRLRRLA